MKYLFILILSVALLSSVCLAVEQLDLKDDKVRLSYSVGFQVGGDFRHQGIEIKPKVILQGVQDALAGNEPRMTADEMRSTLVDLQKTVAAAQKQKLKAQAERNRATGMAFLAENGKKEGVNTLASGLQYKVIKEGTGRTPGKTDTVTVHYRGTLINGTEFDSSYSRGNPATFGVSRVISGWTEALQLMKEGATWQLFIPPDLAYGEQGAGKIEPNSTLIFDVELISIQSSNA
ncbi:MAG: FKBP-type peptidyl-prolyl cis-trans isomerase [Nitrospiraceae bacterium]|nr:MAG: FKBP-type peptidyl-prolyl cis-trans isomerase [Nitrospiraceae bacterium]